MNRDEIPGSKRDAAVWWARFVTPPVFGVALSLICGSLYHKTGQKSKIKVQDCGLNEGQNAKWKVKS